MKNMMHTILAAMVAAPLALTADIYVTPTGAGNKDGSSWANAYAGIQAAVDAVDAAVAADANYAIPTIRVADGTYTRVVVSRNMALDVRSVNGAAATIIDGFNTNRCVLCYANGFRTTPKFTGFTLRNGNVTGFSGTDSWGGGAGGGTLVDCVIEDCAAAWGGGTYRANTQRCIIRRCRATSAGGACAEEGTHRNTLMCQSTGTSYIIYDVTLYNCTVADNAATGDNAINIRNKYNCIVWGNTINGQPSAQNDPQNPKFAGDGDYRLRVGSPGIDGGDATYSTEGYVGLTDLAGNARVQGNAIDLGCYEGTGVEGCLVTAVAGGNGVVSPTSFFTNETMSVTITADTSVYGRPVTAWYTNGVLAASGGNSLTVVMSGNGDIEVTAMFATYEWFVNGTTGSDSNDGSSAATAFKTIAKAVSSAANDETINVAPGTYAPIDTTGRRVNILGTAGAAATIIDGGDSQRCALLSDGTTLTGFTLQHGRSITSDDMQGGGGAMGGTLVACVLKDNIASYGGGALGSTLIRCTVTDNSAAFGGGVHRCKAYNSLIAYNSATEGGGARFGELRGCTVVYNRGCLSGGIEYATVLNSILRYNRTANGRPSYNLWNYEGNCIDEPNVNGEDGEWLDGYTIVEDPLFVDPENGDFRLLAGSPCINYGDVNFYYVDDGLDLADNPRIVDGDPDLGCYEGEVEGYVVSVRVDGHGSVSARTIVVAEGGSATITATADGRAFQRWLVDGEIAGTSTTLTLSNIDADHVVTACFQRNTTTVSGSGAALQNAINAAKDGDTLVVSPGTYSAIVATNRVLDIKSSAGPETTIIQGTNNGLLSGTRAATFSLTVTRPTCTLSGFTLTGGFCGDPIYGGGGVFGGIVSNCVIRGNGALIGGGAAYSMLSHCVISNNTAYVLGGGAAFLALDNCLVTGNEVQFNTIEWVRRLAATLGINLNIPADFGGGAGVAYAAADHCTITKNTATAAEAGGGFWVVLDNSIVAGNTATAEGANQNLFNTPVVPLYTCSTYDEFWGDGAPGFVNATLDDTFVDAAAGDFRLKATSACVDGCDGTFDLENPDMERIALLENGTDLVGSPRWLALAPDIGCYETTPAKPGAVPDVAATRSAYREDVLVSWTGVKHGAWYTIHRGPWNNGAGTFAQAEQIGIVTNVFTWYVDDTAEASVDYRYWVVAHSGAGSGSYGAGDHGYWVAPLVITTESLPDGTVREPWTAQLAATGGIGTYTWEVTQPDWLSFSGATLSGLPRVQGDVWVVVTVMDQRGTEAQKAFQISIAKNPNPQNITISNLAELRQFMEDVHEYYFEGDTVTLAADIDCEGGRFNTGASGSSAYSCFKGTFDGQGHVISNFVNTALSAGTGNTTTFGVAMFDIARDGAVIKNLTLRGHFGNEALHDYVAPFAAYAIGHTNGTLGLTLENCHFIGSVTNYKNAAAFVGAALHGSGAPDGRVLYMTNCTARGSIISTWVYTSGGLVADGAGVEAYDCSVEGVIHGCQSGGLVGEAHGGCFTRCSFAGTIDPDRSSVSGCLEGGLVGVASNAVFSACTSVVEFAERADSAAGAAGVTFGSAAFYDCSATVEAAVPYGRYAGFVGWTAGAETFSNCTADLTVDHIPVINTSTGQTNIYSLTTGGFAASVASDGAIFVDCTATAQGNDLKAGFYYNQQPKSGFTVGRNTFRRCHAVNPAAKEAGFCAYAWNCAFEGCTVRGGTGAAGFVGYAGQRPDNTNSSTYPYAQTSTFTDCSVSGTRAGVGFVNTANSGNKNASTNVFRRCRASCVLEYASGFASTLNKGTIAEDCIGHGISAVDSTTYGFVSSIDVGATIRRCVGAVQPRAQGNRGAGFAGTIPYSSPVEDCYSVYAPPIADTSARMGGFVSSASVGYNDLGPAVTRCFALAAPPDGSDSGNSGSFCGYVYNTSYANFVDCWRPAESNVRDVGNGNNGGDDAGVGALTKAQFANATAATMQNYDFQNVWHAPRGVASSPYLDASVDANTNFWFLAAILGGEGHILVNDGEPAEAYPAGTVLTVEAVPDTPGMPFAGWVGEGFADPTARRTTYTVKNVSAIGASFCTPIYTVTDFTNMLSSATTNGNFALMNDLDFTGVVESKQYATSISVSLFQGKFFGQGHTIRGICTTNGYFSTTFALFQTVSSGAEIRDLTVELSNVPGDGNTLSLAGLAVSVESGVTISNCHTVVDWQGVYPGNFYSGALASCKYYGLAQTVSGSDIHIVDCTVRGRLAGGTQACGFVGSATLTGGEIARCAVLAEVSTLTNRTDGLACGFAGWISLSGGAVVRECFSAGVVDAAASACGFAERVYLYDTASSMRDCYSVSEVVTRGQRGYGDYAYGIARSFSGDYSAGNGLVTNVWFGGTVRGANQCYAFSGNSDIYYVTFANCKWVSAPGTPMQGYDGVAEIAPAAARARATWTGYDFGNVWSMTDGSTTPYFAWSLADGNFRLFAAQEPGATISVPETAAPGSAAAVSAASSGGAFFCGWAGAGAYASASANPTTLLADNHRTARAVWGRAILSRVDLAAVASNPSGIYGLGADIDLGGEPWTPLFQDTYTPFTGTIYGQGHVISNLTVNTDGGSYNGLFGCLGAGATISDLTLVNPVVKGGYCTGTLAGYANGATISGCSVVGATVESSGERAGGFVGSAENGCSFSRCYALGSVHSTSGYVGGFVGYFTDSSASECFACGEVATSAQNYVGGFVGYVYGTSPVSDCYSLADVKGNRYIGGFVGSANASGASFTRCYSAGSTSGSQDVGGFAGYQYNSPAFADCFRISDGLADVGAADLTGVTAIDAADFLDADNFETWTGPGGKWSQIDGKTQPYFAWGLVDGKMTLSGTNAGTGDGSIAGLGAYAPGTVVQISAVPSGSVFLGWTGNAPYADASAQTTTVPLDNFRIVTAEFGALITNRQQLEAITNGLSGSYALGANIDVSDGDWTPIGTYSLPFTGSLYAQGHKITGLRVAGTSDYAGLFRCVKDATLDGIHLEGVSVSGRQYTGALAGDVQGATTIRNCSAEGVVTNTYGYAGLLVGRVYGSGTTFDHCAATGTVVAASQDTGGLVGSVYYYPATFADCDTDVFVTGTSGNHKGGFIGSVRDGSASATFARCAASGDLVATNNSSNVGGFIGYANKPVSFEDCSAAGDVSGRGSTGGFAGKTESAVATYVRCSASGTVVNWSSSSAGGFIGYAGGQNSRFEDCAALGPLVSSTYSQTGGFAGYTGGSGTVFADCSAAGDVRSTSSQTGGFVGYVSASNVFERCVAEGAASGTSQTGGFVGQANGDRSQYLSCVANGSVAGTGNQAGGFVGQIGSTGLRFAQCSALGGVSDPAYSYVGGFVGQVSNSNDLWRCMCAGAAVGKQYVGGFVGYQYGGNTAIRECFALGDATALNAGDAYAGGFAGDLYSTTFLSDSYCLGTVKGQQKVGGFAGRNYNSSTKIERCYAAGVVDCAGTYAGAFIGYNQYVPTFTDCAVLAGGFHAIGSNTAGSSAEIANVAEYDEAGMKSTAHFTVYRDTGLWSQSDGITQPYLAWSAPNGKLIVYASVGGSARGEVEGAGEYDPGATARVTAVPDGGFFVTWTGSTPYADPSSPTTTIALDNHRVAAVQFGKLITTADELDAVRNDLGGIYGLGADIDLLGRQWTPLGDNSKKFTGKFYGFGHEVMNLVDTNNPNNSYKGLFGYTDGAVLDGVTVSGTAKGNSGYYYVGGLVGRADATSIANCHATATVEGGRYVGGLVGGVNNGTSILGCSAAGTVKATSNYAYAGGLAGGCESGTFEIRDSVSSAEVTSTAQYLGGFIGYVTGSGASVISGCRTDGYVGGNGSVGGFVGYVSAPMTISDCVARGDVRSTGSYYGGFVGYLSNSDARIEDCWCSGAVWGTGGTIGSFVGYKRSGILQNCSIYAYGAGPRPFCGSDANMAGGSLTASQIDVLTADWPKVKLHVEDATPISTAEELLAVTNNLSGVYVLTKDIDLEGATISPIGQSTAFSGEFYGKNHKIKNFVVNSTERYTGLFGQISGGRVNGVRAEGTVTGAYGSSGSSTGTGGFAGLIGSQSLVDGCSFEGAVTNKTTYNVGGFVGRTEGSPVILRSCFTGRVVHEANGSADAGGFAGDHNGGYVMDCYAIADVEAGNNRYAAGFAGNAGGRIATSWCAASVEGTGNNRGAFAGYAQTGYITKSYYDSGKTSLLAVNNAAYTGITPLTSAEMKHEANFTDFDFDRTWLIDEGETTPYLQTFVIVKRGYDVWLEQNGLPEDTEPNDLVNGIPAGLRYVYSVPNAVTNLNELATPFFRIVTVSGKPRAAFLPTRDGYEGVQVNIQIYATSELTDMVDPDPAHWPNRVNYVYDTYNDVWKPATGLEYPKMFFRWCITFDRAEE